MRGPPWTPEQLDQLEQIMAAGRTRANMHVSTAEAAR